MNCQFFDRYVFDYCDDNISPALKTKMDEHRQECSRCNNQVKLTNLENQVLRDISDLPVLADDFTMRVMQQITGTDQAATSHFKRNRIPFPASVRNVAFTAAAACLLLFLAVFAQHIIPDNQKMQVADAPPVEINNSSAPESPARDMRSASRVLQEAETTGNIHYDGVLPQTMSNEEAYLSAAGDSSPNTTDNNSAADQISSASTMSAKTEAILYDTGQSDSAAEAVDEPTKFMYWKNGETQSPSRQGGIPDPYGKSNIMGDFPQPQQVPDSFTLINIVNSYTDKEDSIIEYHYTDKDNRLLVIALQNIKSLEPITLMAKEPISSEPQVEIGNASPPQAQVTYNIDLGGQAYQVKLYGTLSAEELGKLAEIISFSSNNTATSQSQ